MTVFVFVGPTIAIDDARTELDADYLPPAAQGDVYRAASKRPFGIGIIDGLFERMPSVWHKEILWAMKEGIHVFGSASMGALRAAELDAFGMVGVGRIFEAYRDGSLEDDDEVAVAHGGAGESFASFSEAMVNIRATLAAAEQQGVVSAATHAGLIALAKSCFYPDRTWAWLLETAATRHDAGEVDALSRWLVAGRVDQKREDAISMLRLMARERTNGAAPNRVPWHFEHTELWEQAKAHADTIRNADSRNGSTTADDVLDELRLDPVEYAVSSQAGLLRMVTIEDAHRLGLSVTAADRNAMTDAFRHEHQLLDAAAVERWAVEHDLGPAAFARLMEDEVLRRRMAALARPQTAVYVLDHLRVSGKYSRFARKAREKKDTVQRAGLEHLSYAEAGITEESLLDWYFDTQLGRDPPGNVEAYAVEAGFTDEHAFLDALLREHYCKSTPDPGAPESGRPGRSSARPDDDKGRTTELYGAEVANPFELYNKLRGDRSHWDTGLEAWLITEFDGAVAALRDRRLLLPVPAVDGSTPRIFDEVRRELDTLVRFRCLVVNHLQGQRHVQVRRALLGGLTGHALERLTPRIRELADEVFDRRRQSRVLDIATEFAHPLADAVMAEVIGVPQQDLAQFGRWCTDVFHTWPEAATLPNPIDIVRQSFASMRELNVYLGGLLATRSAEGSAGSRDDLLDILAAAVARGELTSAELVANAAFVHEAGRHTAGDLICNAMLSLLEHPDELARVRDEPGLLETNVDELLRFDSPVGVVRVATEDLELAGASIKAGETVIPVLNAANRDPKRFADGDRLCLGTPREPHVGFGNGPHFCVGAAVARVEVGIAVGTLVSRCAHLELGPEPPRVVYHQSTRRLSSLPVRW